MLLPQIDKDRVGKLYKKPTPRYSWRCTTPMISLRSHFTSLFTLRKHSPAFLGQYVLQGNSWPFLYVQEKLVMISSMPYTLKSGA